MLDIAADTEVGCYPGDGITRESGAEGTVQDGEDTEKDGEIFLALE
jgi:hypothetical protein